jgi:hypothetical protein
MTQLQMPTSFSQVAQRPSLSVQDYVLATVFITMLILILAELLGAIVFTSLDWPTAALLAAVSLPITAIGGALIVAAILPREPRRSS